MFDWLIAIPVIVFVLVIHEVGHFVTAKAIGVPVKEFGVGYPPRLFAFPWRGTEYSLNLLPFGAFVRWEEEDPTSPTAFSNASIPKRILTLSAGAITNILLPFILLSISFLIPRPVVVGGDQIMVAQVGVNSPAHEAGVLPDDIILRINDQVVSTPDEVQKQIQSNLGKPIRLLLQRGDNELTVTLVPRLNPPLGQGPIGVALGWVNPRIVEKSYPIWEAIPKGVVSSFEILGMAWDNILSIIFRWETPVFVGVVGIAHATTEIARTGLGPLVVWTALLSLGLGIAQLLPIPMLDGGKIVFVLLEAIRGGKKIPPEREGLVHMVGLFFLILLTLVITYNDIMRIIRGESLLP